MKALFAALLITAITISVAIAGTPLEPVLLSGGVSDGDIVQMPVADLDIGQEGWSSAESWTYEYLYLWDGTEFVSAGVWRVRSD